MIELPDDELDKLFRKSSEELDPIYEHDDWNDLRKRLDQQDGRTPATWWRKWWPLGVLALLIPVGIWLYSFYGGNGGRESVIREDGRREEGGREHVIKEELDGQSGTVGESGTLRGTGNGSEEVVEANPGVRLEDNGATGNAAVSGADRRRVASEITRADKSKQKGIVMPDGKAKAGNRNALVARPQKHISTKQNIANERENSGQEAGKSSSQSGLNAASVKSSPLLPRSQSKAGGVFLGPNRSTVEGGDGAFSINHNTPKAANAAAMPADVGRTSVTVSELNGKGLKWSLLALPGISMPVYELPEPPAPPKQSSMSADDQPLVAVRFGYSPDLSTVGLKDFSKPGTAVSLLAEYAVFPRLYVQSGVVWSRKVYYAPAEAYRLPKIPHSYPPAMSGIDGVCKVLEIPVSLRYDITSGQRSRWFGSAGLSSYHMNDEKYKYYFVNPNDPNAAKYPGWNGNTGWYWFSHASISAGYEYRVSRKLSLLAEPSVRLPLRRVGFGNVNLITTGLWLSVRYTPVFK